MISEREFFKLPATQPFGMDTYNTNILTEITWQMKKTLTKSEKPELNYFTLSNTTESEQEYCEQNIRGGKLKFKETK